MSFFKKIFGKKKTEDIVEEKEELKEEVATEEPSEELQPQEEEKIAEETVEETVVEEMPETVETEEVKEEPIVEEVKEEPAKEDITEEIEEKVEEVEEKKEEKKEKKSLFTSLKEKLVKSVSKDGLFGMMKSFFSGRKVIDEEMYEELEDLLIQSDIGMDMTLKIVGRLEKEVKDRGIKDASLVYDVLKDVMKSFLVNEGNDLEIDKPGLNVILVVGVNGVGKTTTIGKLAAKLKNEGKKVIVGAGDTFRAAAIEQLEEWANRADVELIKHEQGSDPGAVVFDTLQAARTRGADVAIIDTAGRLHNKNNLMKELEKINKIIAKHLGEGEYYESLLVIDGTTGQNGLTQAKVFNEVTKLTGFVVTKLDGTAKGGIIFAISEELSRPIKFIGVGEGVADLRHFDVDEYIEAIFE